MLAALNPAASLDKRSPPDLSATRIQALLEQVKTLEQDKRRMKRLLLLARKARSPETLEERLARRRRRARLGLTRSGRKRSAPLATSLQPLPASIATRTGERAC
jgi:hypothetical protein